MSMIDSLIDELNKSADEWNGSNMFELARMCRDAADTIWQLRDDLQRANDAVQDAEHDESRAWDRVRKAEAENAKLRDELDAAKHDLSLFSERIVELGTENAKLRKYVAWLEKWALDHASFGLSAEVQFELDMARRELGVTE